MIKPLFLILKGGWYNLIASGEKSIEYRSYNKYWKMRLENKNFKEVVFQLGYSKNAPRMKFSINRIEIGRCSLMSGRYFKIHLNLKSKEIIVD